MTKRSHALCIYVLSRLFIYFKHAKTFPGLKATVKAISRR